MTIIHYFNEINNFVSWWKDSFFFFLSVYVSKTKSKSQTSEYIRMHVLRNPLLPLVIENQITETGKIYKGPDH